MSSTPPASVARDNATAAMEHLYAALADIGDLVATMPRPEALYSGIVHILERHVGALLVLAGEIDHEAGVLRRRAPERPPEGQEDIYPETVPIALAPASFWEGKIEVDPDIVNAPGRESMRPAYARHGIRAAAAVPVLCFGKVQAALILRARDPAWFAPELLQLLDRAAVSIGHALEGDAQRSRLDQALLAAERSQRALRLLSETLKVAMHADVEADLLGEACRVVVDTGGYPVCWMGLLGKDSLQTLESRAHAGRGAASYQSLRLSLDDQSIASSVTVAVARSGEPVVRLPREGGEDSWATHARSLGLGALLGLPLHLHGQVIGVIVIGADSEDAFPNTETLIFAEMAQELSMGLERLRARNAQGSAEQALKLNLRRFQSILASRYAGVLVMDAAERVQFCNATLCRMFDLAEAPEQLIGLSAIVLDEKTRMAYANPDREVARIGNILRCNDPVDVEEISISGGRTYLRSFTPIMIDDQSYGRAWHLIDITERKAQEAALERLAYYDPVTELPNRRLFFELLERGRGQARRHQAMLAVAVLDLDGFKHVNDHLGHAAGDEVLKEVARRIGYSLREGDVVARLGGDEFAIMLADIGGEQEMRWLTVRLLEALRQPLPLGDEVLRLSASLGWTLYPKDDVDTEALMRHADIAMYKAKDKGRDRDQCYSAALEVMDGEQRTMKTRVADALDDGDLVLHFQPIVAIDTVSGGFHVIGAEALLRLRDAALGLLPPALFHSALDDIRLARPIGRHVLHTALQASEAWLDQGLRLPVAVNISTRHLMHPEFIADLHEMLATHPKIDASFLGIEITETGPLLDPAGARVVIDECRAMGVNVSLDDFGTGSASLSHIQQMDADTLKIDQSFVRDILLDSRNTAIAAGIITTARLLGVGVIAEGVETEAQGALLVALGCLQLQGYFIAKPMPVEAVPAWMATWTPPASWVPIA